MRSLPLAVLLLALLAPGVARAVEPDELLPDPALEARARSISSGLRCMVCQNESIDDSHAALARDLRVLVRDRLKAGDSDAAIRDALVARYGSFILLKPPLNGDTVLLWGLPFGLLLLGGAGLVAARRRPDAPIAPLTREEQAAVADLLRADRA